MILNGLPWKWTEIILSFLRLHPSIATPVVWPPHGKSWLIGKDSDAGRDWGQDEKGMTEDEMAGWHHWLDGHESEWAPGVGDGQGGLVCCDSWGRKESDTTEWLIWSDLIIIANVYFASCNTSFITLLLSLRSMLLVSSNRWENWGLQTLGCLSRIFLLMNIRGGFAATLAIP